MGKDVQEALLKLKMDLGNDAVILNTRKIKRKGILNFFKKPLIEVLAAIDEDYDKRGHEKTEQKEKTEIKESTAAPKNSNNIAELEKKVEGIESILKKMMEKMQNPEQSASTLNTGSMENPEESKIFQLFLNNLVKNDVDSDIANEIIIKVKSKINANAGVNEAVNMIYNEIKSILGEPEGINADNTGKGRVVIFVGPTGVGKTTTVAKIAAEFALNRSKNVALITADTYRIAAIEQLKTYAEILGIPLTVVYTPSDIENAINANRDKDLILIDTAGRSHRNKAQFEELKTLVNFAEADEVYLLLSAATNEKVCREILSNYSFLKSYKLIFTKMDESPLYGIVLNTVKRTGKKLSYFTTGQNVPDDIERVDTDKVIRSLLGRML